MGEKSIKEIMSTMRSEHEIVIYYLVGTALETGINYLHGNRDAFVEDTFNVIAVYESLNSEQKAVVDKLIEDAILMYEEN